MARVSKKMFKTLQVICGLSAFAAFGLAPTASSAATIDVTPSSMGSWAFDNRDSGGVVTTPITGSMVTGPATPPLGTGSANLTLAAGTGDGGSELRTTQYVGLALSTVIALSYSTYDTANNGSQFPYLALDVNWSGGTTYDDRLFFEPPYQQPTTGKTGTPDQGAEALNTWQTWNAMTGSWWANSSGAGTTGCSPGTGACTLVDYLLQHPNAAIITTAAGLGGVQFRVGFASAEDAFNGYVDNFTIGINGVNTTYDFELAAPAATPLPAALPLFATGVGALGLFGWRRKRKIQAAA